MTVLPFESDKHSTPFLTHYGLAILMSKFRFSRLRRAEGDLRVPRYHDRRLGDLAVSHFDDWKAERRFHGSCIFNFLICCQIRLKCFIANTVQFGLLQFRIALTITVPKRTFPIRGLEIIHSATPRLASFSSSPSFMKPSFISTMSKWASYA